MTCEQLLQNIRNKQSFLCVGLDTDIKRIPESLLKFEYPLFEFNKQIVDSTSAYAVAYKPNIAFYESQGIIGWKSLKLTVSHIRKNYPDIFLIADAKRGDIANSSEMYAKTFFEYLGFDAVTVSPYMGKDSILPFLKYNNKWIVLLALTSNPGAKDFQFLNTGNNNRLFESIVQKSKDWGNRDNMMYVCGATRASLLVKIRSIVPDHFILVPGVGAQGGSLQDVVKYGKNDKLGLIVNSSRSIIYAANSPDFADAASLKAEELQTQMQKLLIENHII
jgi:orotidine-5'-phosphate decarboxylase